MSSCPPRWCVTSKPWACCIRYFARIPATGNMPTANFCAPRLRMRARGLGLSTAKIRQLLKQAMNTQRSGAYIERSGRVHLAGLDRRIAELVPINRTLAALVLCGHGDHRLAGPLDSRRVGAGTRRATVVIQPACPLFCTSALSGALGDWHSVTGEP